MATNPDYAVTLSDLQAQLAGAGLTKQGYTYADHTLSAWTGDVRDAASGSLLGTVGTITGTRVYLPAAASVGGIWTHVTTVGVGLTTGACRIAMWDSSGALVDLSEDMAAKWMTTGPVLGSLAGGSVLRPAGFYDVGMWWNGTTSPTILRHASHASVNLKLSGQNLRAWTDSTNLTRTTTAPATLGTKAAQSNAWWVGLNP